MTGRFEIGETTIPGVYLLERMPLADERGWLERMYDTEDLADVLGGRGIVQVNRTLTRATGTVRGMHYQLPPSAEAKIVSCLRGAAFDVAVDLRRDSPTFLQWHAETLSAENHRSLVIPEGVAPRVPGAGRRLRAALLPHRGVRPRGRTRPASGRSPPGDRLAAAGRAPLGARCLPPAAHS